MDKFLDYIFDILNRTGMGVKAYVKAQLKLMFISFLILSLGLWYIKAPMFILVAFLIALIDIIPVVGSGLILVPWSIISFLMGNQDFAMKMALLYVALVIIRQILEPKIVGDSIGLRPLYTFLSILLGSLLLGPLGVIFGPIIAIFINSIYLKRKIDAVEKKKIDDGKKID